MALLLFYFQSYLLHSQWKWYLWKFNVFLSFYNQFPEETEMDLLSVTIDGPSHYSSTSEGSCSVFGSPKPPVAFSPGIPFQPEEGHRDDSLSSSSEDSEKEDDHERERPYFYKKPP